MHINFIVTCYNREEYYPYLYNIINSYKKINSFIVLCYNGNDLNFKADIRRTYLPYGGRTGEGHPSGCEYAYSDCELMVDGYQYLKGKTSTNLWVKLSVDSWLLDEDKIIEIFELMKQYDCPYAGNVWYIEKNRSTDICFFDTSKYNLLQQIEENHITFFDYLHAIPNPHGFEHLMYFIARQYNQLIIKNREPIESSTTRWSVPSIGWVMHHELDKNVKFMERYSKKLSKTVVGEVIAGTFIPYRLNNIKPEI